MCLSPLVPAHPPPDPRLTSTFPSRSPATGRPPSTGTLRRELGSRPWLRAQHRVTLSPTRPLLSASLFPGHRLSLPPSPAASLKQRLDVGKGWAAWVHRCSTRALGYAQQQENRARSLIPHVDLACAWAFYSLSLMLSSARSLPHSRCADTGSKVAERGSRGGRQRGGEEGVLPLLLHPHLSGAPKPLPHPSVCCSIL